MLPRATTPSGGSEAAVANEKRQRLKARLIEKVLGEYSQLGGPRLGATGKALLSSQVELAMTNGLLKDVHLRQIAQKVSDAQRAENQEMGVRPSTSQSSSGARPEFDVRPSSRSGPLPPTGPRLLTPAGLLKGGAGGARLGTPAGRLRTPQLPSSSHGRPPTNPNVRLPPAGPRNARVSTPHAPDVLNLDSQKEDGHFADAQQAAREALSSTHQESGPQKLIPGVDDMKDDGVVAVTGYDVPVVLESTLLPSAQMTKTLSPPKLPNALSNFDSEGNYHTVQSPVLSPIETRRWNEKLADWEWDKKVAEDIAAYQAEHVEAEKLREAAKQRRKMILDDQCKEREMLREMERDRERQFNNVEMAKRQQWENQCREEEADRQEARRKERENLQNQMEAREAARQKAEQERKDEEQAYADMIAAEHRRRKMEELEKKEQAKREYQAFLVYNEEIIRQKAENRKREFDRDKAYLAEYTAYLDAQEKAYQDGLARIADKQRKIQVTAEKGYFNDIWELQRRDAERAEKEQQLHEQQLLEDERRRIQRVKDTNWDIKCALDRQLEEKERLRQQEIAESLERRRKLDEEIRKEKEAVKQERIADAIGKQDRRKELDKQVAQDVMRFRRPVKVKIMGST